MVFNETDGNDDESKDSIPRVLYLCLELGGGGEKILSFGLRNIGFIDGLDRGQQVLDAN